MITNTEMRDLVRSQKNHELTYILEKKYIEREVDPVSWDNDLIKVMIGPRRAGKSHFLIHQLSQLGNFSYINFDTMALTNITNYEEMLSILDDVYGHAVFTCLTRFKMFQIGKISLVF